MACLLPLAVVLGQDVVTSDPGLGAGLVILAQAAVSWWIWSVWTWRFNSATAFRGGKAESLLGEFKEYGYSTQTFKAVGFVKLLCATLLGPVTIIWPNRLVTAAAAAGLGVLMLVAIVSHFRVGDPLVRNVPAAIMFVLSSLVLMGDLSGCVEGRVTPRCQSEYLLRLASERRPSGRSRQLDQLISVLLGGCCREPVFRLFLPTAPPCYISSPE